MKKQAFIVGINYTGTGHALRGCINDADNMKNLLTSRGFDNISMCLDEQATTANILKGLNDLVKDAVAGDVLVFHYSGHGSQLPNPTELDRFDEIICPVDLDWKDNVIRDNQLKLIFDTVPDTVNITVVLDCCHSGNALDQMESATISPSTLINSTKVDVDTKTLENRYLPPPDHIGFEIQSKSLIPRDWSTSRDINKGALLIAGCKSNQTSADAFINGKFQGAATAAILEAVALDKDISYQNLIDYMNSYMIKYRFTQRPMLDGSHLLYGNIFLNPWPQI